MDNVCIISHEVYDEYGDLMEEIRELIVKRISYLLLPGSRNEDIKISPQGHIHLENLIVWLTEDCGIMVEEEDMKKTVAAYMQDRVTIMDDNRCMRDNMDKKPQSQPSNHEMSPGVTCQKKYRLK